MKRKIILSLLMLMLLNSLALAFERRGSQFLDEPSYLLLPLPYSVPGIGQGWMFMGLAGNMFNSYTDVYGVVITGDAQGQMAAIEDIHLIKKRLQFSFQYQALDKAQIQYYESRGMDSKKEDYKFAQLNKVDGRTYNLTASFWQRRLELSYAQNTQGLAFTRFLSPEGDVVTEFDEPYEQETTTRMTGMILDFTDDWQDPRRGVRLKLYRNHSPPSNALESDFYVINKSVNFYLPMGKQSTWAFDLFHSDAFVTNEGQTDSDAIKAELGISCPPDHAECLATEQKLIQETKDKRTYGTAETLGGENRMRAYPFMRFHGAHTRYYATEFRWNVSEKVVPFNFWIWKDVATSIQLAFFYEYAATEDEIEDLGQAYRSSTGAGVRMVSASGYVYRWDYATGDEGSNLSLVFSYPW